MRVVLINPKQEGGYPRPPLGLLSVATTCRAYGYETDVIDANLLSLTPEEIMPLIRGYDVVGLTAMTVTINETLSITQLAINTYPKKKYIIGGVHATIFPFEMLRTGYFDCVICRDGELALIAALEDIERHNAPMKSRYVSAGVNYGDIPLPDYSLIELDKYIPRYPHGKTLPWTCISTSRGCPFNCTFCSKAVFGKQYRCMSADQVITLVKQLKSDYGIKDITFYDDEFVINKRRTLEVCDGLQSLDITWTCEARVDCVDSTILNAMKQAGCRLINYGIESGNQRILDTLNKGFKLQRVVQSVEMTHEAGINAAAYFMLGCPGETHESIQQTLDFAKFLQLKHAQFSICTPLPGSELYADYIENGGQVIDRYLGGDNCHVAFANNGLSAEEIISAVNQGNEMFSGVKV